MSNIQRVIDEYFNAVAAKNKAIAFLVERVRMLSNQRDDLTKKVIELTGKIRSLEAQNNRKGKMYENDNAIN